MDLQDFLAKVFKDVIYNKRHLTQKEAAYISGYPFTTLQSTLNGKAGWHAQKLLDFCEAFHVEITFKEGNCIMRYGNETFHLQQIRDGEELIQLSYGLISN